MPHTRLFTLASLSALSLFSAGCATEPGQSTEHATELGKPRHLAPDQIGDDDNAALLAKYCIADEGLTQKPMPRYDEPLVQLAANNLSRVASHSYSLYSDMLKHHASPVPAELDGKVTKDAHDFLTYLCGEFRDRATMVEAKLRWVGERFNYLDDTVAGAYDPAGDPWMQMKAADYHPYLAVSSGFWHAKEQELADQGKRTMNVGAIVADTPVVGQTVCETKYMFAEYVKKGRDFDTLAAFREGYTAFRTSSCTLPGDEDHYYDFRGDSNIKPNSPESNGMLWLARTIGRQCSTSSYAKAQPSSTLPDAACRHYYQHPFTSRWNAARAGLASWTLIDPNQPGLDSNSSFTVVPRAVTDAEHVFGDLGPYLGLGASGAQLTLLPGWQDHWERPGIGLAELQGSDVEKIQRILQQAVDRHTDWYSSKYDDQMAYKRFARDQAYSPFVASSYEMSESDNFTSPGTTVTPVDPTASDYKHFMFVFRVHKDNWYTPESVVAGKAPDFDRQWFDETSFGDTGLANSEKAWDRLGTALEAEHDAVLYLHNLEAW
jgi:hypothetical protein